MTDFIQINRFSHLHDGRNIIFCKTDFLFDEFKNIEKIPNDITLITGNSDYPIDEHKFYSKPSNIKKWYAQNALVNDKILIPLPIGIENKLESDRFGHGVGYYDRVLEKEKLLSLDKSTKPTKEIYANFKVETNFPHRNIIKNICVKSKHIEWNEPNLSLNEFFTKILEYKMVVCPVGNGVDTHRLWEVLYSDRIPITIKVGDFKIYEMYEKLPIIILQNISELENEELIYKKYLEVKQKKLYSEMITYDFWKNKILHDII